MSQKLLVVLLTVAMWQVEMGVSAGIAASRRPLRPRPAAAQPSAPCKGGTCPTPTSQPRSPQPTIIVR